MANDEFTEDLEDEVDEPDLDEDLEEEDLEEGDDDLIDDDLIDDDDLIEDEEEEEEEDEEPAATTTEAPPSEEEEEDEEELDPDDVEADLDSILKERLVVVEDEVEYEDETPDPEDRAEGTKVRPRAPGEFVCQSCFLVKHPSQLADEKRMLCRDCV